jgi:hypothetical protein
MRREARRAATCRNVPGGEDSNKRDEALESLYSLKSMPAI